MPQMAPMNWTLLFIIFAALYLITMALVYFNTTQSGHTSSELNHGPNFNATWKW